MSERANERPPPDSLIASTTNPPPQSAYPTSAPVQSEQHGPRSTAPPPAATSPSLQRYPPAGNGRTMELPPLPRAPTATGGSFSPASRSIGVSSILNPTDSDDGPHGRRRKISELSSPASSMPILPPLATSDPAPHSTTGTPTPASMNLASSWSGERPPRRILTPRSPSLHRAASLNQLNPPSAAVSTQYAPFAVSPRNRAYAIEPGTAGAPPLPTPPAGARQSYGFSAPTPPTHAGRKASIGAGRGMRPASESTSPRSSYSSYSQAGQMSPPTQSAPAGMPTLSSAYTAAPDSSINGPGVASAPNSIGPDRRSLGVPITSSGGQNVYQMMTLETTSGTVQLPVDVQAASRVADEKRRRNAGASARFRQRRKEKEKESSTTIGRLEQQLKEVSEDMDFYKRERDYLAGVVLQVPGGDRHFPRPQSPRLRRSSSMAGPSSGSYMSIQEHGGRSPDEGRNLRRRTSTLSLPPPPPGQALPGPSPAYPTSYAPQNYGQPLAPQPLAPPSAQPGPGALPSPMGRGNLPAPPVPPQLMQAPPQTGPWNPYADRRPPGGGANQGRDGR